MERLLQPASQIWERIWFALQPLLETMVTVCSIALAAILFALAFASKIERATKKAYLTYCMLKTLTAKNNG